MHWFSPLFIAAALLCASTHGKAADVYPSRPIRIIVPYAAGGADQQIRPLLPALRRILGQALVIESVGGGGGMIGANAVKSSAPDGYTMLYTATGVLSIAPKLMKAQYRMADFAPVCNVIGIPFVVAARKDAPYRTIAELSAYAKARPGEVSFGSAGPGTGTHMTGEAMAAKMDAKLLHVPFQGVVPAVTSLLGSNVDLVVGAPSVVMPQVRAGKIMALAMTSAERFEPARDVPTLREQGVDVADVTRYGFFAPAGTPPAIINTFVAAIQEAMNSPEYVAAMREAYNGILFAAPQAYRDSLVAEDRYYQALIERLKLAPM